VHAVLFDDLLLTMAAGGDGWRKGVSQQWSRMRAGKIDGGIEDATMRWREENSQLELRICERGRWTAGDVTFVKYRQCTGQGQYRFSRRGCGRSM
jgi:hypothetical protein